MAENQSDETLSDRSLVSSSTDNVASVGANSDVGDSFEAGSLKPDGSAGGSGGVGN